MWVVCNAGQKRLANAVPTPRQQCGRVLSSSDPLSGPRDAFCDASSAPRDAFRRSRDGWRDASSGHSQTMYESIRRQLALQLRRVRAVDGHQPDCGGGSAIRSSGLTSSAVASFATVSSPAKPPASIRCTVVRFRPAFSASWRWSSDRRIRQYRTPGSSTSVRRGGIGCWWIVSGHAVDAPWTRGTKASYSPCVAAIRRVYGLAAAS